MNAIDTAELGQQFRREAEEDMLAALATGCDPVEEYLAALDDAARRYRQTHPADIVIPSEHRFVATAANVPGPPELRD